MKLATRLIVGRVGRLPQVARLFRLSPQFPLMIDECVMHEEDRIVWRDGY